MNEQAQGGRIKKQPVRHCIGCNQPFPKKELLRVVRSPEGEVSFDFTGKKSGRGAYLCRNSACFKKARKSGRLSHNLDTPIPEEVYERLEAEIKAAEEAGGDRDRNGK